MIWLFPLLLTLREPATSPWDRQLAIDAHLGTHVAPYGAFGASVEWTALDWTALAVGVGVGSGAPQFGALAHLRAGDRHVKVAVASGLSAGRVDYDPNCSFTDGAWLTPLPCSTSMLYGAQRIDRAVRWNAQLAFEGRTGSGFHLALAFGLARILNQRDWRSLDGYGSPPSATTLYVDMSIGGSTL
jgi:hypothetical protein